MRIEPIKLNLEVRCILIREKALSNYFRAVRKQLTSNNTYKPKLSDINLSNILTPRDTIIGAFEWKLSIEGFEYWDQIDKIIRNEILYK